jgi:hypothetical protein
MQAVTFAELVGEIFDRIRSHAGPFLTRP